MTRDPSDTRWLGLEIGPHRYAVDLRAVSHVLVWQEAAGGAVAGLHNAQGLLLHEGQPVVIVAPAQIFSGALPDAPLQAAADPGPTGARLVNAWLVIFRSAPAVAAHGLRVDRTVGPFRAGSIDQAAEADASEIDYAGQRWRVVPMSRMHLSHSPNRTPEEALP